MRCQTLVFRSGISMSATSSKVLQAKIACRNSSALFQHSSLNHRVLGYRSATSSCSFRSGNGSGLSPYSYSMEITRPCILIQYPNIPCHFTLCAPFSTYFVPVALHYNVVLPLLQQLGIGRCVQFFLAKHVYHVAFGGKAEYRVFKSGFHCK